MSRVEEKLKIKQLLIDAITLLCRSGMRFENKFCIEALIAITLDEQDVVLININETVDSRDGQTAHEDADNESKNVSFRNQSAGFVDNSQIPENTTNKFGFPPNSYFDTNRFTNLNSDNFNAEEDNLRLQVKYEQELITNEETDNYAGNDEQNNCSTIIAEETDNGDDCFFVKSECMDDENHEWSGMPGDATNYNAIDSSNCANAPAYHFQGTSQRKSRIRDRSLASKSKWKPPSIPSHNRSRYGANSSSVLLQEQRCFNMDSSSKDLEIRDKMADKEITFGTTSKGRQSVIHKQYEFIRNQEYLNGTIQWRCKLYQKNKCLARLKTKDNEIVGNCNPKHNHGSNKDSILAQQAVAVMKEKMAEATANVSVVIGAISTKLEPSVLMALPRMSSLKRTLQRRRHVLQSGLSSASLRPPSTDPEVVVPRDVECVARSRLL